MFKIIFGLLCVMIANVLLGVTLAKLKSNFKKDEFLASLVKYVVIILSVLCMYITGYLNQDIMVANINGIEVNLLNGMEFIFISGIMYYGMQDLIKLKDLLGISKDVIPIDEEKG